MRRTLLDLFGPGHPYAERVVRGARGHHAGRPGDRGRPGLACGAGQRDRPRRGVRVLRARRCRTRARSTWTAHGACSSSPSAATRAARCGACHTSPPRTSPASTPAASARTTSTWASAFATPTSSRSSRPSASIARSRGQLPITVFRPSIIVGERDSGWTASFNVLYWPLRAFSRGTYLALPARGDAPVDVVPVDYVADAVFALSQIPRGRGRDLPSHRGRPTRAPSASSSSWQPRSSSARLPRLIEPSLYRALVHPLLVRAAHRRAQPPRAHPQRDLLPVLRDAGRASTIAARGWRCAAAGSQRRRFTRYFDRLVAFALAAEWGRRRDHAARAATGRGSRRFGARPSMPAAPERPRTGEPGWCSPNDQPAPVGARRVVPRR